jgi:hypothetical protein
MAVAWLCLRRDPAGATADVARSDRSAEAAPAPPVTTESRRAVAASAFVPDPPVVETRPIDGCALEVTVIACRGAGVDAAADGAAVEARGGGLTRRAATGPDGAARFFGLPSGGCELSVELAGYSSQFVEPVWLVADVTTRVTVRLLASASLEVHVSPMPTDGTLVGVVVAPQGDMFSATTDAYAWSPGDSPRAIRRVPDPNGRCLFESLPPGAYRLGVEAREHLAGPKVVRLGVGEAAVAKLELTRGASMEVVAVDESDGGPAANVRLGVVLGGGSSDGMTGRELRLRVDADALGRANVSYLPGKHLFVVCNGPEHFGSAWASPCYGEPLRLQLRRALRLFVEVLDADGAPVVSGAFVRPGFPFVESTFSQATDGVHEYGPVNPDVGSFRFFTDDGRYGADIDVGAELAAGRGSREAPIRTRIEDSPVVELLIVDDSGRPASGARVHVRETTSASLTASIGRIRYVERTADADGRLRLRRNGGLVYAVTAFHPVAGYAELDLAGSESAVVVRLERVVSVEVACVVDERPAPNCHVVLQRIDGAVRASTYPGMTDGDGVLRVAAIPPGRYRVISMGVECSPRTTGLPIPIGAPTIDVRSETTKYLARLR